MSETILYQDLERYIMIHNDVPGQMEIKLKTLSDPVQLKFLKHHSSQTSLMDKVTVDFKNVFVHSIIQDYVQFQETSLRNFVRYITKARGKLKNVQETVNCKVVATIDRSKMKIHDALDITITIPCYSTRSLNNIFEIFSAPINILIPIADIIDEIVIESNRTRLDRIIAKIYNIDRNDFDYLFEKPAFDIHEETAKQWMKQFHKVYTLIKSNQGSILSIACKDGLLDSNFTPVEIRAQHQYFKEYSPAKKVTVYRADAN